jgi:hypothetical protein
VLPVDSQAGFHVLNREVRVLGNTIDGERPFIGVSI